MKSKVIFLFAFLISCSFLAHAQIITTVAGDSTQGYNGDNIPAVNAELYYPTDVAIDAYKNVYIADGKNNRIRKINSSGIITTIAGTGVAGYNGDDIAATLAEINYPSALTLDASGNIYFCDDHNFRIRMINTSGVITTIAGTGTSGYNGDNILATSAQITTSGGIAVDVDGHIYIGDNDNNRIRQISSAIRGTITTIAGTGSPGHSGDGSPATNAELNNPTGVAIDGIGNIYIAEFGNKCIRKINVTGIISTIAGTGTSGFSGDNGPATIAELSWPNGLKVDASGNIFFADVYNNRIRKIDNSGIITTIAGTGAGSFSGDGGLAILADLNGVEGLGIDNTNNIYIADWGNDRIRFVKSTVSVKNQNLVDDNISIYPNPSNGIFTADIMSTANETATIVVTNILGQRIKEITTLTNQLLAITIDVPSGIYFLTAITNNNAVSKKILLYR